jgi:hypothetical protein
MLSDWMVIDLVKQEPRKTTISGVALQKDVCILGLLGDIASTTEWVYKTFGPADFASAIILASRGIIFCDPASKEVPAITTSAGLITRTGTGFL